ncbi:MAG: hypothetical protein LBG58_00675 [Planctomycetaceae bacterium]|jgi:hypothetical protein|nr:hypothetical protein [Planctomycetaceae bacterium]
MTLKFIEQSRRQFYKDTQNMTSKEKLKYISEGAKVGQKRLEEARKKREQKETEPRSCQVLIRLTESERSQLETDAKQERTTLSSLIRYRALKETNHLSTVISYLKRIESKLK